MTDAPSTSEPREKTTAQPFRGADVTTVAASHWIHDTYTAFLPPLLPAFIENLALSNTRAGLLTVFLQIPSLLQPVIGHLGGALDLRYVAMLGPAVTAIAMSLLGLAPSYGMLALLLLVAGLSSATFHAVVPVLAGKLSGEHLGRGMGFWMVGGELGRTLGPAIVAAVVSWLGLRGTPWLMVGGLAASLLLYLRLRALPGRMAQSAGERAGWWRAVSEMRALLLPLSGLLAARSFMQAALMTYLPVFMRERGAALWLAGAALTLVQSAGVLGALLVGSWSDRVGRKRSLFLSMVATPLLMALFLRVRSWGQFPLLLLMGFAAISVTPVLMAWVQEVYPRRRSLANGVYMGMSFVIRSGVVVLVGALGDWFGLQTAFWISAGMTLLGLPFVVWMPERAQ
jgi:FSR family fosmidomycin resistance protein-like MFS transporter